MHLGIDFGTSYTKLAQCFEDHGKTPTLITSPGPALSSAAAYLPSTGGLRFGDQVLRLFEPGSMTALFFKLALKRNPNLRLGPYGLDQILTRYFGFLKDQVGSSCQETVQTVTLSVPNYFGMKARRRLLTALERTFAPQHIALLPEPIAALLGYNHNHPAYPLQGNILIIDVGGGTTDFSFLSTQGHPHKLILETQLQIGQDAFSGLELDWGILRNILEPAYRMQTGQELPAGLLEEKALGPQYRHLLNRLLLTAEKLKIELSSKDTAVVDLPDLYQGHSLTLTATPAMFEAGLASIFHRLDQYLEHVLTPQANRLGLHHDGDWDLDHILLLGGASQVRGLRPRLQSFWNNIPLHHADMDIFYVAQGNCCWTPETQQANSIYTLYPFQFFIEKQFTGEETRQLEPVPLDTANLELDIQGRYPIFSFSPDTDYNLKKNDNGVEVKVYESSSESESLTAERFAGLDQILHLEEDEWDRSQLIHLYLDMAQSKISTEIAQDENRSTPGPELFHDLLEKQQDALDLISHYKYVNPDLLQAFQKQIASNLEHARHPYENHLAISYYKLVCLVQLLNPK